MKKALFALICLSFTLASAQAQYKVLWSFVGAPNDGAGPVSSLIFDKNGILYGTTEGGGSGVIPSGVVFELSPNSDGTWTETVLYNFCSILSCLDGAEPMAGLVFDSAGNLYGTTIGGGANSCDNSTQGECGTVFELSPPSSGSGPWTETVLYNFCPGGIHASGCQDGAEPTSQLAIDRNGNLYGTTTGGGTGRNFAGTVFRLSHGANGWRHTVIYNFCSLGQNRVCPDGSVPQAGVTLDRSGNLLGTTQYGGSTVGAGSGTLYKLSHGANGWTETVLIGPGAPPKGGQPLGAVSIDALGNLYSTFSGGGTNNAGGIFGFNAANRTTSIFSFDAKDGDIPTAGLLLDSKRSAGYGTTKSGGANNFFGSVYQITAPSNETVLYSFCSQPSCADGETPMASLIEDNAGNLYGTAMLGGAFGIGVVFEITPPVTGQ